MAETVTVRIPTALRPLAEAQSSLEVEGATIREVLGTLASQHPELGKRLFKAEDQLNGFINVYLNDEDIRFQGDLETAVKPGDSVSIIPAIAGG